VEEEDGEPEPEVEPNFAEAREVLVKVKSFFCAHSNSNGDLPLERNDNWSAMGTLVVM
jgi:hypothetical protein